MLSKHYSPKTQIQIIENICDAVKKSKTKKIGVLSLEKKSRLDSQIYQEVLSPSGNIEEAAKNFYAALHRLDHMNLDLIVTSFFPDKGIGKTINDRLKRAVKK